MKRALSLRAVNVLYLVTILLIVVIGGIVQSLSLGWGLLATEAFLILAPTLFFLRRSHLPLAQSLPLKRISVGIALAALMVGVGAWLVDMFLSVLMMQLTGYVVSSGASMLPTNALDAVVIALGMCIAAPLCEETLFRGAVLGAYKSAFPAGAAIAITSLMFAFYHMQLQGLLALLPIAFALTFIAWRTNSIFTSMIAHFANNSMAVILLILAAFRPDIVLPVPSLPAAGIGLLLLAAGLVAIVRLAPRPVETLPEPAEPAPVPAAPVPAPALAWIARYWPLLTAAAVYAVIAGVEVLTYAKPALPSGPELTFSEPAGWSQPASFSYNIFNRAEQQVGEMNCQREPSGKLIQLDCQMVVAAYEVKVDGGTWSSSGAHVNITAHWTRPDLKLADMNGKMTFDSGGWYAWAVAAEGGSLKLSLLEDSNRQAEQALPTGALVNYEWPLRLMAANLSEAQVNRVDLVWQNTYRPQTKDSGPVLKSAVMQVHPVVKIGDKNAWQVTADKISLWYAVDEPHTLLKFDDGFEIYLLK
jgi:membrane protease YdiL (CAAX protease family)